VHDNRTHPNTRWLLILIFIFLNGRLQENTEVHVHLCKQTACQGTFGSDRHTVTKNTQSTVQTAIIFILQSIYFSNNRPN
jgi:hypothetical protein